MAKVIRVSSDLTSLLMAKPGNFIFYKVIESRAVVLLDFWSKKKSVNKC